MWLNQAEHAGMIFYIKLRAQARPVGAYGSPPRRLMEAFAWGLLHGGRFSSAIAEQLLVVLRIEGTTSMVVELQLGWPVGANWGACHTSAPYGLQTSVCYLLYVHDGELGGWGAMKSVDLPAWEGSWWGDRMWWKETFFYLSARVINFWTK